MALHTIAPSTLQRWQVDPGNTRVEFTIGWSPLHRVQGRFGGVHGRVDALQNTVAGSRVRIEIDTASIDTGLRIRDRHLREKLFLDAEQFPLITFESTGIEERSDGTFQVDGELTLRGMTRAVSLSATLEQRNHERAVVVARTTLDRRHFGIGPLPMGLTAGNRADVRITLVLIASR